VSDVQPLFAVLRAGTRPLGDALPASATPAGTSPWSPKAEASAADVEAERRDALEKAKRDGLEQGRAEGKRETDALRARLAKIVGELEQVREVRADRYAEAIADVAITAIEAWIGSYDRAALFQPIVRAWLTAASGGTVATARVNPADAAAMAIAIGEAPIRVEPDPAMAAGDVEVRNDALDTTLVWRDRLRELRDAIATAIEHEPAAAPEEIA
jgi:flagellar biosynthesis/type III secretory pathway protein FliH